MIDLSPATEALARRLADAEHRTVDETIRQALEARRDGRIDRRRSPEDVAARIARMREIAEEIAAMPDLDQRSTQEIIDDINTL